MALASAACLEHPVEVCLRSSMWSSRGSVRLLWRVAYLDVGCVGKFMNHLNVFVSPLTTAFGVFKAAACCSASARRAPWRGCAWWCSLFERALQWPPRAWCLRRFCREQRATATSLPRLWSRRPTWSNAEVEGYLCVVAGVFICLGLCHVVSDAALDVIEYGSRLVGVLFFLVTAFWW